MSPLVVAVHCHEGKSRSITLALAFLMESEGWTFKQALEHISKRRPSILPNAGFQARLLEFERRIHGIQTVKVSASPD